MQSMEQRNVETNSPGSSDEGEKGENVAEIDLSNEKIDTQKSLEAIGNKEASSEARDTEAQSRVDGIGDGDDGQDGKPDDFSEQSINPSENLNEIKETSPKYQEAQQEAKDEAQKRLDDIADK